MSEIQAVKPTQTEQIRRIVSEWLVDDGAQAATSMQRIAAVLMEPQPIHLVPVSHRIKLAEDRQSSVYLAGPMTGYPDFNFPAFNACAAKLRGRFAHVVNPAEHGIVEGAEWGDYLRYDIARLAGCASIALLPGWSKSRGAQLEVHIAQKLGMPILLMDGAEEVPAVAGEQTATDQPAELYSEADEARMDVVGQNGNGGEHYQPAVSLDQVLAVAAPAEVADALAGAELPDGLTWEQAPEWATVLLRHRDGQLVWAARFENEAKAATVSRDNKYLSAITDVGAYWIQIATRPAATQGRDATQA